MKKHFEAKNNENSALIDSFITGIIENAATNFTKEAVDVVFNDVRPLNAGKRGSENVDISFSDQFGKKREKGSL